MATSFQIGEWQKMSTKELKKLSKEFQGYMDTAPYPQIWFDRKDSKDAIDKIIADRRGK